MTPTRLRLALLGPMLGALAVLGCGGTAPPRVAALPPAAVRDSLLNIDKAAMRFGLVGEVVQGPLHPSQPPGPAETAPLAGAVIVIEHQGERLGRVVSDSTGQFYVELPADWYLLIAQPVGDARLPAPPAPERVFVPHQGIVRARLTYDTGIR